LTTPLSSRTRAPPLCHPALAERVSGSTLPPL
jgi:hypothetical protein